MSDNGAIPLPSSEDLRKAFTYDAETGKLYYNRRTGGSRSDLSFNAKYAGKEAFVWCDKDGYRRSKINGRSVVAHRVIWKLVYGVDPHEIDHINHDRADNRLANLRDVTRSENLKNALPRDLIGKVEVRRRGKKFRVTVHYETLAEAMAAKQSLEREAA